MPLLAGNLAGLAPDAFRCVNQQSDSVHVATSFHAFAMLTRKALYSGILVLASPM
jgi:hypothetical protein